jgi:hypothetical protein
MMMDTNTLARSELGVFPINVTSGTPIFLTLLGVVYHVVLPLLLASHAVYAVDEKF